MRIIALAAAAAALISGTAGLAHAAPATVDVRVGPELHAKAARTYGLRDVNQLADELRSHVQRELDKTGAYPDSHIVLELTDAVPNRPTFQQLADNPSLSFESYGTGGAEIEGHIVAPDGHLTPVSYRYYDSSILEVVNVPTWYQADWTIERFARDLVRGQAFARR